MQMNLLCILFYLCWTNTISQNSRLVLTILSCSKHAFNKSKSSTISFPHQTLPRRCRVCLGEPPPQCTAVAARTQLVLKRPLNRFQKSNRRHVSLWLGSINALSLTFSLRLSLHYWACIGLKWSMSALHGSIILIDQSTDSLSWNHSAILIHSICNLQALHAFWYMINVPTFWSGAGKIWFNINYFFGMLFLHILTKSLQCCLGLNCVRWTVRFPIDLPD